MAKNGSDCYESGNTCYETPPEIYQPILDFIEMSQFAFDVCCSNKNIPANVHLTEKVNGLNVQWGCTCWINPPFNVAAKWVKKAIKETQKPNCDVWMIIPVRTKEKYQQELMKVVQQRGFMVFLKGKVKFIADGYQDPQGYRHPCMLVYLCHHPAKAYTLKQKWQIEKPIPGVIF